MISTDFYPSAWNDTNVQASPTQLVQSIPITTPEFTQAYWLGWLAWENLPQQYKISRYNIVDGRGVFTDVTRAENVPVGYTVNDDGSNVPAKINAAILTNNGEKWQNITYPNHTTTAGNNVRLPNSLNVNTVGYNGVVILGFVGFANTAEISGWVSIGINNFINDDDFTVTFTNGYVFTAKPSDFSEYALTEFDVNDVHYSFALGMYKINYTRDVTIYGGSYGYQGIRSMLQTHTTDDKAYIQSLTYPVHYQNNNTFNWGSGETGQGAYIDFSGNVGTGMVQNTDGENVDIMGGFVGEFDITSMVSNGIIHPENATFYIRGILRSDLAIIGRIFTYDEIYKTLALAPRIAVNGVNQYVNSSNFYYAKVNLETNEFLTEFVSGDKIRELTDWQIIGGNINANEFTDEDIPEYEPSGDEDEESGDRIPNQFRYFSGATNFITQYALTRTQVGQFGTKLWTSWADSLGDPTDMWKNFKIFIGGGDTGSIDIGTVLSFIVSLRVFPFDLSAYLGQSEPSIKIGTGNYPIEVANVWKLLSTVTYIDCGTVNVPRKFNDFRDYTNVTVSCYFPYCGTVQLNAGDVVGKTLHAWYAVDLQSGECLAILESYDDTGMLYNVASISGSMGALIPITATNSGQIMAQRISDAANVAGFFVGNVTRGADIFSSGMLSKKKSVRRQSAMISGIADAISGQLDDIGDMANQGMSILSRGAIECPSMSGGSGLAAFMTPDSPYIQLRYGIYSEPNNYSHSVGRVSTSSNPIGNYKGSGYIVCENVDTSGLTCHNDEKAAIAAALETGVFV